MDVKIILQAIRELSEQITNTNARLDRIEERLDRIEERLTQIEVTQEKMKDSIDLLAEKQWAFENDVYRLKKTLNLK
ncbi:hypothetical protein CathTA2_1588 [Caldalkalibacillus thermarum TA2.A1]|uniref:Uncharacterized protein n=1 Tax=Caldalkalibacillus thermarum (strain TA2.A1) TaxID=986075 RepID=F5L6Y8_CALTT|nr:hypothetical protein [Caldalkalibacillus thermarum]EGL82876.1 hypothetical protein CathTA2_1588 [Caldalkalibacillus thermarum TA2.A1]QZT34206.1 hypothetical protein HUR95_01950 [Caldalkalibacillus thermarum TA2.A1]